MKKKFILNAILINICILSSIILFTGLILIKNLSNLRIISIFIIYLIITVLIIYCYLNKKNLIYNIGIIITIIITIISFYNINNLNKTYSYLENIFYKEYKYNTYDVYVNKKNTKYSNLTKLNGKKIGMLEENSQNIILYLDKISNIEYKTYQTSDELISAFTNGEIQSIIINTEEYKNLNNNDNIKSKIVSIYTNKIKELI